MQKWRVWNARANGFANGLGSVSRFHVIDDTDLAGAIPYLPKG